MEAVKSAIREVTGLETDPTATGGTSDGRYISPAGAEVVELGPVNATIHQINEQVSIEDLDILSNIYEAVLNKLLV
jgi:succinyl-diaminopimelate desuccinylase